MRALLMDLAEAKICNQQCVLVKLPRGSNFNAWLVGLATRSCRLTALRRRQSHWLEGRHRDFVDDDSRHETGELSGINPTWRQKLWARRSDGRIMSTDGLDVDKPWTQ
jgi:hypothetical protein